MYNFLINSSVDIVVLIIIGTMMYIGYKKGVIMALFDLLSFLITGIITYNVYPIVTKLIVENTNIYTDFSKIISEKFDLSMIAKGIIEKEDQIKLINDLNIPVQFKQILIENNNSEIFNVLDVQNFQDYISAAIATIIINIIVFVLLFIIINIVLSIFIKWMDIFNKIPFIRVVNKMMGAIFGLCQGCLIIFMILLVISMFFAADPKNHFLMELIDASYIGSFFYKNNPFTEFVSVV